MKGWRGSAINDQCCLGGEYRAGVTAGDRGHERPLIVLVAVGARGKRVKAGAPPDRKGGGRGSGHP
jgi:hypothetical protein